MANRWRWPMPPPQELDQYLTLAGFTDDDKRWVWGKAVPQPLGTYRQPLRLTNPAARAVPRSYIHGTLEGVLLFAERVRTAPGWDYHEVSAGHWAMITKPHEVAGLLAAL